MSKYKKRTFRQKGIGRPDVFPFKLNDFNEMIRICLRNKEKADTNEGRRRWWRNYIMLILGVNTGLRIETLLQLMPYEIAGGCTKFVEFKTGKVIKCELNEKVVNAIEDYLNAYELTQHDYIFAKKKGAKPITRQMAYKIIHQLADEAGVKYKVGCHSLRKSYARWEYDRSHDIHLVQRMLGHVDPSITMHYICLEDTKVDEARKASAYGVF